MGFVFRSWNHVSAGEVEDEGSRPCDVCEVEYLELLFRMHEKGFVYR